MPTCSFPLRAVCLLSDTRADKQQSPHVGHKRSLVGFWKADGRQYFSLSVDIVRRAIELRVGRPYIAALEAYRRRRFAEQFTKAANDAERLAPWSDQDAAPLRHGRGSRSGAPHSDSRPTNDVGAPQLIVVLAQKGGSGLMPPL